MAMSGYALVDHTPSGYFQIAQDLFHNNPDDLVYDWLTARGVSWRVYYSGSFFFMQMPRVLSLYEGDVQAQNLFRPIDRLIGDFQSGDLPQVVFIEPLYEDDYRRGTGPPPTTIPRRPCTAVNGCSRSCTTRSSQATLETWSRSSPTMNTAHFSITSGHRRYRLRRRRKLNTASVSTLPESEFRELSCRHSCSLLRYARDFWITLRS